MLYFFTADIHGNLEALKQLLTYYTSSSSSARKLFILGDLCNQTSLQAVEKSQILQLIACLRPISQDIIAVKGNNDSTLLAPLYPFDLSKAYRSITIQKHSFFLMHGDMVYAQSVYEQHHVIASGHTHEPHLYNQNGRLWLNPGSLGMPRGYHPATFAVYNSRTGYVQIRALNTSKLLFQEKLCCP